MAIKVSALAHSYELMATQPPVLRGTNAEKLLSILTVSEKTPVFGTTGCEHGSAGFFDLFNVAEYA